MNPLEEGFYALRTSAGTVTRWVLMVALAAIVVVAGVMSAIYFAAKPQLDKAQNAPAQTVPKANYVSAVAEIFQCINQGPKTCSQYPSAVKAAPQLTGDGIALTGADGRQETFRWTNAQAAARIAPTYTGTTRIDPSQVTSVGGTSGYNTKIGGQPVRVEVSLTIGDTTAHVNSIKVTRR